MLNIIVPGVLIFLVLVLVFYLIDSIPSRTRPFRYFDRSSAPSIDSFSMPSRFVDKSLAYTSLLNICFGDRDKAERLIQFELHRCPGLSRDAAIQAAVDQIAVDNRRWRS